MSIDEEYLQKTMRTVSNDISSALRAAVGFSKLIVSNYSDKLDDKALSWLSLMEQEGQKAQSQLASLSQYARLYGDIDISSKVDLKALCEEVAKVCSDQYSSFAIQVEDLPVLIGNEKLWRQYFMEVLSNSAQYSNGACKVYSESIDNKPGWQTIVVADDGSGIEPQQLELALQAFRALDPDSTANGMGLSTAKRIVELHGGIFSVVSAPNIPSGLQVRAEVPVA